MNGGIEGTNGRTDGWTDGRTDEQTDEWTERQMNGLSMYGRRTKGRVNGWMADERTNKRTDG